jgi:phosphate/sulfate permease
MIPKLLTHLASLILFLNTGANDILVSCATPIGSRSLHRRIIVAFILISTILTYIKLKNGHVPDSSWIKIIEESLENDRDRGRDREVLAFAVITSTVFTVLSILSKFPLPLDVSFCSFFYGYLFIANGSAAFPLTRSILLSYLILPIISGCFTWCIYRILIRGILFVDAEEKFKRTLSWCGVIYPSALAASSTTIALKYFFSHFTPIYRFICGALVLFVSFGLAYGLFKIFLRAWIKRRAFLMYPQEYAVYMERSEKVEQGDREARGLGPIQDYYLPKTAGTSSNLSKQSQTHSTKDTNSTILQSNSGPTISPAVVAGKLALISKRSEELFRPILNVLSVTTLFTLTSFESRNVLIIVNKAVGGGKLPSPFLFWSAFLMILPGCLFLSRRYAVFLGRSIINDMKFSQAFAIQLGCLFTITLGLFLHSIPLAPMWYLLFSIAAVCSSQEEAMPSPEIDSFESAVSFRRQLGYVVFLWTCSIGFSAAFGFILKISYQNF